ncbi:MAG TPA: cyclic pyranopterin monophosphate synthase MoaC [Acidimicrobiales bacterium]|nr:cyclic pyranopterin monophosphate synthase MoaC [Acidimicrobiales bacterium]
MSGGETSQAFTHFDKSGHAVMVDVTDKAVTHRRAEAHCWVRGVDAGGAVLGEEAYAEAVSMARVAGMFGAKRTSSLIPLCHPLPLSGFEIAFVRERDAIEIIAVVETESQTGVEMEALGACGVAALSIVAWLSSRISRLWIDDLELLEKSGGRSGQWVRDSLEATTSNR